MMQVKELLNGLEIRAPYTNAHGAYVVFYGILKDLVSVIRTHTYAYTNVNASHHRRNVSLCYLRNL